MSGMFRGPDVLAALRRDDAGDATSAVSLASRVGRVASRFELEDTELCRS